MAHKRSAGIIDNQAALGALVSTVRQEIVDTIESIGDEVAVADIAAQLGRPADGLYYHLRRLVASGVLRAGEDPGDGRGRRYRTAVARGTRVRLKYGRNSRTDVGTVAKLVSGLVRTADRDFRQALDSGTASGEGPQRDLWASRLKGWVGAADLREINALLVRLSDLLHQPRSAERARLITLAWVLAPIDSKPLRRSADSKVARKR